MCATCGCERPNERSDGAEQITLEQLHSAAHAAGISMEALVENIIKSEQIASGAASGHDVIRDLAG